MAWLSVDAVASRILEKVEMVNTMHVLSGLTFPQQQREQGSRGRSDGGESHEGGEG